MQEHKEEEERLNLLKIAQAEAEERQRLLEE